MRRTILITGASTGIGAACAFHMAAGNEIFIHYNTSREAASQVARQVEEAGGTAHLVQADLTSETGCRKLFEEVSGQIHELDVLINNAGGLLRRQHVGELEWELMERVFALNTFSTMLLTSMFVPFLRKGTDPSVINITSIAMRHGAPTATLYGASKGAIDSFTRGAARELAPDIRVNAVAPGVIITPFHEKYTTPERMEKMKAGTPLREHGESRDIAEAVAFLVNNTFTTGETIDVNGGLFMY